MLAHLQPVKVAIIGSGVSGLSAAWHLIETSTEKLEISVFEKDSRLGGHTNTVTVELDGLTAPVDTGFLVCNERTYPLFIPFLKKSVSHWKPLICHSRYRLGHINSSGAAQV
jgi:predicted NAD/FAD-binding protein